MTEDKAEKALRKVIINLIPQGKSGGPIAEEDLFRIDVSDKLIDGRHYCLHSIQADYGTYGTEISYVSWDDYNQFKIAVENILDATIVNSKQRDSIQKLLDNAFYTSKKFEAAI